MIAFLISSDSVLIGNALYRHTKAKMQKQTTMSVCLPTLVLKENIIQLPNVTFKIGLTPQDALVILQMYLEAPHCISPRMKSLIDLLKEKVECVAKHEDLTAKLSPVAMDSLVAINKLLAADEKEHPILATLFFNDSEVSKAGVLSKICGIHLTPELCILDLKGELVGFRNSKVTVTSPGKYQFVGEIYFEITPINKAEFDETLIHTWAGIVEDIRANIKIVLEFLKSFETWKDDDLGNLLKRLDPLGELMFLQFSEPTTMSNLVKLEGLTENSSVVEYDSILKICDAYMSTFPFSYKQELQYLSCENLVAKLNTVSKCVKFMNMIFTKFLNIDHVYDSWNRLGRLKNGKVLQSRFIVDHLRSFKKFLEAATKPQHSNRSLTRTKCSKNNNDSSPDNFNINNDDDNDLKCIEDFIVNIDKFHISEDGKTSLTKDYNRLRKMQSQSSEYQQLRNYFDIIMEIPFWTVGEKGQANIDINNARKILDRDHYGMESVKERIIQHLAVLKLTENTPADAKSPILLLNGPPGVGKTSLAKSIAQCLNLEFQRISLGGVNDFADIKGHRRTYVGAIPGLVIQAIKRSKSMNLVILLDEIDKVGVVNSKGNPAAALLELLDPEQNSSFTDHYVGFPIDLSRVVFIATSNNKWEISEPLLDRLETVELGGYKSNEKIAIAQQFLLPRQMKRNGVPREQIRICDVILELIVNGYTHEPGIRNLERLIGQICRAKAIESVASEGSYTSEISKNDVIRYLGVPVKFSISEEFSSDDSSIQEKYGLVNGLSYNSDGSGSLLKFEMIGIPGEKRIFSTGRLGNVLLESCAIAETLVEHLFYTHTFVGYDQKELVRRLKETSVHMHVPEGAIQKDGPSAGLTMTLCYLSLILRRPVPSNIALTGEITLTAKALPIGGLKEKLLGASLTRSITKVLVPRLNRQDLIEIYADSIDGHAKSREVLTKLVLDEEDCLLNKSRRYSFSDVVESWIEKEYGIIVKYVDDFMGVISETWNGDVKLVRTVFKANL